MSEQPQPESQCARLARLLLVRDAIATGEVITEGRFGEDMTRFSKANLPLLNNLIREAQRGCELEQGRTSAPVGRAIRGTYRRPY